MCGYGLLVEKFNFNVVCIGLFKLGKSIFLFVLSGEFIDNIELIIGMYIFYKYVKFFFFFCLINYD